MKFYGTENKNRESSVLSRKIVSNNSDAIWVNPRRIEYVTNSMGQR